MSPPNLSIQTSKVGVLTFIKRFVFSEVVNVLCSTEGVVAGSVSKKLSSGTSLVWFLSLVAIC